MSTDPQSNPNMARSPNMHQQGIDQPTGNPQGLPSGSMHDGHTHAQLPPQEYQQQPNMSQQFQIQQQPNPVNREMIQKVLLL